MRSCSVIRYCNIILIAIFLVGCGNGKTFTRAAISGDSVFWGDSITYLCDIYIQGLNRSYPGDTSIQTLELVEYYRDGDAPANHHVLIGVNDVWSGIADTYIYRLNAILALLKGEVTVTSILPTDQPDKNKQIIYLNNQIKVLTEHWGYRYRDLYDSFSDDETGLLAADYSLDGVHLTPAGCARLFSK